MNKLRADEMAGGGTAAPADGPFGQDQQWYDEQKSYMHRNVIDERQSDTPGREALADRQERQRQSGDRRQHHRIPQQGRIAERLSELQPTQRLLRRPAIDDRECPIGFSRRSHLPAAATVIDAALIRRLLVLLVLIVDVAADQPGTRAGCGTERGIAADGAEDRTARGTADAAGQHTLLRVVHAGASRQRQRSDKKKSGNDSRHDNSPIASGSDHFLQG
jgi:hypothetical protein